MRTPFAGHRKHNPNFLGTAIASVQYALLIHVVDSLIVVSSGSPRSVFPFCTNYHFSVVIIAMVYRAGSHAAFATELTTPSYVRSS